MARLGRDSFKRFMKTILEQLPPYIKEYPTSDQILLTEFLSLLQHHEKADYQRKELSQRFLEYYERIYETDEYINTAFLWFTSNYIRNTDLLLNISKFHADSFYEYLVKHLRGSSTTPGVYKLVLQKTPLTDLAWEKLQYESNKLLYPLSKDQFQILLALYSFIQKGSIDALNPRNIIAAIINQVPFQPKLKPTTELSRFFRLIDGTWYLRFHSPAFGLYRLFFHFELNKESLGEIIDFLTSESTVLGMSEVYYERSNPTTHIGTLVVPIEIISQFIEYFHNRETEGDLNIIDLTKIHSIHRNVSFDNYKAGTGWLPFNKTKKRRLTSQIKAKHPRKRNNHSISFETPGFNTNWNFRDHPLPSQIIQLYCKLVRDFSFSSLPLQTADSQIQLSHSEIGLLKQLLYNQVVHIGFIPYRLVNEFALDSYWIKIPKIPQIQLKIFLNTLPFCEYYITDSSIQVWTQLSSELRQWIEDELMWEIHQILPTPSAKINYEWFNQTNLRWIPPALPS